MARKQDDQHPLICQWQVAMGGSDFAFCKSSGSREGKRRISMMVTGGGVKTDPLSDIDTSSMRLSLAVSPPKTSTAGPWRAALMVRSETMNRAVMAAVALPAGAALGDMRIAILAGVLLIVLAYPTGRESVRVILQPVYGRWHSDDGDGGRGGPRTVRPEAEVIPMPRPRHARSGERDGQ
ncbi:hypothetical protein [Verrucosispora sp. WMMC514]|uniref:hypothetical protein n=1 Tax=Verrucosispora sp. WMMC514 TaxID=3015156 RepID=UPI00248C5B94|nr:hypothetical protein [Verrucosispora sp. WMMC514]WBB93360.1 hypothetical protein O7597_10480 [Verrucosispora sp. WMMC514]